MKRLILTRHAKSNWDDPLTPDHDRPLNERGKAAAAQLVPLYADAPAPQGALDGLADGLRPHLPISVLLLGMGADMHTASLFPDADLLEQAFAADAPATVASMSRCRRAARREWPARLLNPPG